MYIKKVLPPPYILFIFEETKTSQIPQSTRWQLPFALAPPSLSFQNDCILNVAFSVSWMRSLILPTERWGYPKNHQNVFQKPLLASQMSSPCPAPGCTGIRQEPALSLYRQNQTDRPLHMSSSMIIDSGKLKPPIFPGHQLLLVFSFLSINSFHSDPPPKGWHFSSCASWGEYPSLFWNSILRNCRQRVSRIAIFLPGKREA